MSKFGRAQLSWLKGESEIISISLADAGWGFDSYLWYRICSLQAQLKSKLSTRSTEVEGPKSPEEVLTILQRVLEESAPVLVSSRLEAEERRNNLHLREEQDAAYLAALEADQSKQDRNVRRECELFGTVPTCWLIVMVEMTYSKRPSTRQSILKKREIANVKENDGSAKVDRETVRVQYAAAQLDAPKQELKKILDDYIAFVEGKKSCHQASNRS
ncbi:Plant UBX domain-containing protein [Forsythia ovata]|uniref:Plant UBX domain-containing protein n=1 Tax=Forsythia ovata TaxID=205694 RepID=A0ABD1PL17_9LAMI